MVLALAPIRMALAFGALAASLSLSAQTLADLDALSDQTATEASGIEIARQQTGRGELLEALATLERVLAQFPKSDEARFNHAMLLCWVGDPQGALVEFDRLDEDDYASGVLKQAQENCRSETEEDRP